MFSYKHFYDQLNTTVWPWVYMIFVFDILFSHTDTGQMYRIINKIAVFFIKVSMPSD